MFYIFPAHSPCCLCLDLTVVVVFYEKHVWKEKTLNTKMEIERELKKVSFAPVFFVDILLSSGNAFKVCRARDRWQKSYSTVGYFKV